MISNDTYLNILCTFASIGNNKILIDKLVKLSKEGTANIMIDSGAFTAFNAKKVAKHINVEDYSDFLIKYGEYFEKYVMLDVIGNAEESKKNYEIMISKGLRPMYVVTMYDNDFEYIEKTLTKCPHICVAGGATTKGEWMTKRFQQVYEKTGQKAKIHGLAYVTFPKMLQLNLESVDSSSWKAGPLRFGGLQYFNNGIKSEPYAKILKKGILNNKHIIRLLEKCRITPTEFVKKENHKGNFSIGSLISIIANIEMQKYCYKRGLRYFLAVNNLQDLQKIEYVVKNWGNWNYQNYKAI